MMEIRVRTDLGGCSFILPDLQEDQPPAMAGANSGGDGRGGGVPVVAPVAAPEQPMPNPGAMAPSSSSKHYRFVDQF